MTNRARLGMTTYYQEALMNAKNKSVPFLVGTYRVLHVTT